MQSSLKQGQTTIGYDSWIHLHYNLQTVSTFTFACSSHEEYITVSFGSGSPTLQETNLLHFIFYPSVIYPELLYRAERLNSPFTHSQDVYIIFTF